jgi:hypothetical protein
MRVCNGFFPLIDFRVREFKFTSRTNSEIFDKIFYDIIFVQNVLWTNRCLSSLIMASRSTRVVIQQSTRSILIDGIQAFRIGT